MPETLRGLWKQRLRWAKGGAQVLRKNFDVLWHPRERFMWPLLIEMCASVFWSYLMVASALLWMIDVLVPAVSFPTLGSPLVPYGPGLLLGATCLLQFALSKWLDSRYEVGLGRNYYWMIWYPAVFWVINLATTVVAYPQVFSGPGGQRARWISPDRGVRPG
jgi:biofilm PGA synthesis N-glycosyltransferase PgaC